ncbi:max-binding protein MNT-like [Symsagittifera roscoffensis]|uniref:max-binding protein MNT-like n=1 Tax=Symsagittifera roscoffensis TaxID=84072 RepID=UPI00307B247C
MAPPPVPLPIAALPPPALLPDPVPDPPPEVAPEAVYIPELPLAELPAAQPMETPDQSVDEVGKKTTESTPIPNAEEPNPKPIEFSPIDNVEDTTGNTPETVKDESQAKRTSFTERLAIMVGMKSRDAAVEETKAEKGKIFGTVSTRTIDTDQNEDQIRPGTATNNRTTCPNNCPDNRTTTDHGTATLELGDLMAKLDQIDEKLKHSEEDRDEIRKEIRNNKYEYLDSYFHLARATEEKLQQMSDKIDTTDEERDKNIRKTPDQSVDEVGKKTTESTPMPTAEEPNPKPIEFSPIDNVEDTTGNTPEMVKDESQAKRTSFTERLAIMVGMKSRDAAVEETKAEKGKIFGTVSTRTIDTDQNEDQIRPGTATNNRTTCPDNRTTTDQGTATLELARATEEKLQQMSDKIDTTDEERDKNIRKDMREMKQRYDAKNSQ